MLICEICKNEITSGKHNKSCTTVNMYQIITQDITEKFKPMMTYGLCGCTTIIIFLPNKIIFGHHPFKDNIIEWYKKYTKGKANFKVVIKTPGYYVKIDKKWELKSKEETFWKDNINNIILSPYYESVDFNHYRGTLYCKLNQYTNIYGKYLDINM